PMVEAAPPGVDPDAWREAVAQTHAALVTLTASNVLDAPAMQTLGASVSARVARARAPPETARAELAALWDGLRHRAAPILGAGPPRPALLPPRAAPKTKTAPAGAPASARPGGTKNG